MTRSKLTNKLLTQIVDALINDRIDMYGVRNTIQYLLDIGCTKPQLLELKFDESDIDIILEDEAAERQAHVDSIV